MPASRRSASCGSARPFLRPRPWLWLYLCLRLLLLLCLCLCLRPRLPAPARACPRLPAPARACPRLPLFLACICPCAWPVPGLCLWRQKPLAHAMQPALSIAFCIRDTSGCQ
ncbi:hypothetical protein IW152_004407 [Coemansia sp. BCRC 34962]|nr:hypothetical protein IW152_004407 [Coemansia sp. BCRC 34962]